MNTFQKVDWLCAQGLRRLINKLHIASHMNTDYNKEFTKPFAVGETVRVPKPQKFSIRDGWGYSPQNLDRPATFVTVDQAFGVDFEWNSAEKALDMERGEEAVKREYLDPAMDQIAQEIDSRAALRIYQRSNNVVGTLGTQPASTNFAGSARQRLLENACPAGDIRCVVSPAAMTAIVNGERTTFNPTDAVAKAFREGYYGRARSMDFYESMSLYAHVAGTWAGTVEMSSADQSGASIALTATTGDTFKKGDKFNIAGVYNVNPSTRRSTGVLKEFTVLADVTAAASAATIEISPAIVGSGHYQNVDSLPANGADLTLLPGTTSPNGKTGVMGLAFHRDAFALVGVPLEVPQKAEIARQMRDPKTGLAIRFVRDWDNVNSRMTNRFDVLIGFGDLYPDECSVAVALG